MSAPDRQADRTCCPSRQCISLLLAGDAAAHLAQVVEMQHSCNLSILVHSGFAHEFSIDKLWQ